MTCDLVEYLLQGVEADSSLFCKGMQGMHMCKTLSSEFPVSGQYNYVALLICLLIIACACMHCWLVIAFTAASKLCLRKAEGATATSLRFAVYIETEGGAQVCMYRTIHIHVCWYQS